MSVEMLAPGDWQPWILYVVSSGLLDAIEALKECFDRPDHPGGDRP